jgi:hypothetical protein
MWHAAFPSSLAHVSGSGVATGGGSSRRGDLDRVEDTPSCKKWQCDPFLQLHNQPEREYRYPDGVLTKRQGVCEGSRGGPRRRSACLAADDEPLFISDHVSACGCVKRAICRGCAVRPRRSVGKTVQTPRTSMTPRRVPITATSGTRCWGNELC